mgnify:CR=1 FL=1
MARRPVNSVQPSETEAPESILEMSSVSVIPPGAVRPVVQEISLELRRGEMGLLLGGNGAGKSTILRAAAGLWAPAQGELRSPSRGSIDPRLCALLLEEPAAQFVASTAAEEIAFTLENAALAPEEIPGRVEQALEDLDLARCSERDPLTLSPGEQQRLLVAAALALRPRLLLLDDPFLYLGSGEGWTVWTRLREALARGVLLAVLIAAQDGELAVEADRVGILDHGRLLRWGPPNEVLRADLPPQIEPPLARRVERALRDRGWKVPGEGYAPAAMAQRLREEITR